MKPALTGLVFIFFIPTLFAQPNESLLVPRKVMDSFTLQYPDARNVKWEQNQDFYVADFSNYNKSTTAILRENGSTYSTETQIQVFALPLNATAWLMEDQQVKKISDASIIQMESGTISFKAYVRNDEYWFDARGQLIEKHLNALTNRWSPGSE